MVDRQSGAGERLQASNATERTIVAPAQATRGFLRGAQLVLLIMMTPTKS
jgi:hypothetical protein